MKGYFSDIMLSDTIKKNNMEKKKQIISFVDAKLKMKVPYPNKSLYFLNIPANIFQTWHTKTLPPGMQMAVNNLKASGIRFKYQLFDDNDCKEFIKNNFDESVFNAYNSLKPGAYKADLWRYCVLYKEGGIYLDIKYFPVNAFQLKNLIEREHFCLDADNNGIYNAIMVCKPGNTVLKKAIYQIVENVKTKYYGKSCLDPTGPGLLSQYFTREEKNNMDLTHEFRVSLDYRYILYNKYYVFQSYPNYRNEHHVFKKEEHYGHLWNIRNIYN